MPVVETNGLSKTYKSGVFRRKDVNALKGTSLSVGAGEIFGLLGPNGAGKTTFVKILLSIVRPTDGGATVLDQPLGKLAIRQRSGYLPENHRYPLFLTGFETLLFFGRIHGLKSTVIRDKAKSLLKMVGLTDWANVKIKRYSKGMTQRLGLAQALLNDPELLFLDEPTDGVDPIGRKEIRDLLKQLRVEGRTVFLNSHLLSEVEAISDRVAILNKGEVLKSGTISEITTLHMEYELQFHQPISDKLLTRIQTLAAQARSDGKMLVIAVSDKQKLNEILDLVRSESILIDSVIPRKTSLEDYFVNLIRSEENR